MFSEIQQILSQWEPSDTWIVITAALAAMACALPGTFLVLRRQSMMGDALTHTVLPGIVAAFLFAHWLKVSGWIGSARDTGGHTEAFDSTSYAAMFLGALVIGVLTALLTEWVQKLGRVESSAALGVVYTTLFAIGLLMIRIAADSVHIDPDCVLYGNIETVFVFPAQDELSQSSLFHRILGDIQGLRDIPRPALVSGLCLAVNAVLLIVFFKELRITAFDPALATSLGINSHVMHYALMAVTAATAVASFESVGNILVLAMLIVPPATAHLVTDRLPALILAGLVVAAMSAALGHVSALTLPPLIFGRLGFDTVDDASTSGMMAVACGFLFLMALLFGPRHGIVNKVAQNRLLGLRIACEDILGMLYRFEEQITAEDKISAGDLAVGCRGAAPGLARFAVLWLRLNRKIALDDESYRLTQTGRAAAKRLVRSHRLWESYVAKHFNLPDDHLHESAARVEHFLDAELMDQLAAELDAPNQDPHGRTIPTQNGD